MSCAGSANAECRRATGKRIKCEPLRCCHPCWFSAEFFPCSIRELIDCRACDAGWTCISMTICSTGTCRRQRRPSWQRGRLLLIQSVIIFSAPLVLLAPFRICARLRFDRGKEFSYWLGCEFRILKQSGSFELRIGLPVWNSSFFGGELKAWDTIWVGL
jgi:hypothetical protein